MSALYRDPQLHLVLGVTLTAVMGVSSLIPVLPQLMAGLQLGSGGVGLVLSLFTLPGVVMAPLVGVLADRYGRKVVLVPALVVFGLSGALCGLAPDFKTLLALRLVQGLGAAPLGIMSLTLIADLYDGPSLAQAMGLNAATLGMGTAIFPAVGGLLGLLGWRLPFALALLALPLAWVVAFRLRVAKPRQTQPALAYLRQTLGGMRRRPVIGLYMVTLAGFLLLYGPLITFYPLLVTRDYGATAPQIGLLISVASVFGALAAIRLGRLAKRFGEPRLIAAGAVCYAICFALAPLLDSPQGSLWYHLLPLGFFGLGQGLTIPSVTTLLSRFAPAEYRGGYMAMNATLMRLAQTVGPVGFAGINSLFGACFAASCGAQAGAHLGLEAVFWAGAAMAGAMLLVTAAMVRRN